MLPQVQRLLFVLVPTVSTGVLAEAVVTPPAGGFDEHQFLLVGLVGLVGTVASGIAFYDRRVEKRLSEHEQKEFDKDEARDRLDEARHAHLLSEIAHVRELVDVRDQLRQLRAELPAHTPSRAFRPIRPPEDAGEG